jgi:hypothetical protein
VFPADTKPCHCQEVLIVSSPSTLRRCAVPLTTQCVSAGLVCNEAQLKYIGSSPHYAVFLDRVRTKQLRGESNVLATLRPR